MSSVWIDQRHCQLKKYAATVTGSKSVVKIEITVDQPAALSYLLENLGEIEAEQKRAAALAKAAAKKTAKQLALPAPVLGLPDYSEGK